MKTLVLGGSGLLGTTLCSFLEKKGLSIVSQGVRSNEVDIKYDLLDKKQLTQLFIEQRPDIVINLVALTDVDLCQREPLLALNLNANLVKNIESNLKEMKVKFLHISTDHVYHKKGPSKESEVCIRNIYAATKLFGDMYAELNKSIVLRTNFFGKSNHPSRESFSDWIIKNLKEEKSITLYRDVFFNPLSMKTLSEAIYYLITEDNWNPGMYNLGSKERISKYDFGLKIANYLGFNEEFILQGKISDSSGVSRPKDMSMNLDMFEDNFQFRIPSVDQEITLLKEDYL